jgi:hypothetical protein
MSRLNTHSKRMRALADQGVTIRCSVKPYEGSVVKFAPRYATDRDPWVLAHLNVPERYSGAQVHPDLKDLKTLEDKKNGDSDSA